MADSFSLPHPLARTPPQSTPAPAVPPTPPNSETMGKVRSLHRPGWANAPRRARFSWDFLGRDALLASRPPHLLWGRQAALGSLGRARLLHSPRKCSDPPPPICPSWPQQTTQKLRPPQGPEATTAGPTVKVGAGRSVRLAGSSGGARRADGSNQEGCPMGAQGRTCGASRPAPRPQDNDQTCCSPRWRPE